MKDKTIRYITYKEYIQLLVYHKFHRKLMEMLEDLELDALKITKEVDSSNKPFLGNETADLLNCRDEFGVMDMLKFMGIEIKEDSKSGSIKRKSKKKYRYNDLDLKSKADDFILDLTKEL